MMEEIMTEKNVTEESMMKAVLKSIRRIFPLLLLVCLSTASSGCIKKKVLPMLTGERPSMPYIQKAEELSKRGDLRKARAYLQLAVEADPDAADAAGKLREMDRRISALTMEDLLSAESYIAKGEKQKALQHYLRVLALSPGNKEAVAFVRGYNDETASVHVVQKNETLASLAMKEYGDPEAAAVIAGFNNVKPDASLKKGTKLYLPSLDGLQFEEPRQTVVKSPAAKENEAMPNADETEAMTAAVDPGIYDPAGEIARPADDLLDEAEACLLRKHYGTALANVEQVLKKYKNDPRALDMRNATFYALGSEYYNEKLYHEAFDAFSKADPSYRDTAGRVDELRRTLSEQHYTLGVKYFVEEKIDLAVEEWQNALKYDPQHPHAAGDIAKVKQLKEKLGNMQ